MQEADPIEQVYNAIWQLAESSKLLTSYVKMGNRIKYNASSEYDPFKSEVSNADFPELALVINRVNGNIGQTSSSSGLQVQFDWWISTGDPRVTQGIGKVLWAVYCAMTPWVNTALTLTWKNQTFVKNVTLLDASLGFSDPEKNRGIEGWSAVWGCTVDMYFKTDDLTNCANEV